MKTIRTPQIKYICGASPYDAVEKFNESMLELSKFEPTYERISKLEFYIFYELTTRVAEDYADELELQGIKLTCKDCRFCQRQKNRFGEIDKRVKRCRCMLTDEIVFITSAACDRITAIERSKENGEGAKLEVPRVV